MAEQTTGETSGETTGETTGETSEQATGETSEQTTEAQRAPRGRSGRAPVDIGEAVWRISRGAASVVRVVGIALAAVLVANIALTVVGVNPTNGVAQVVGAVADVVVLAFRDLFLPADPVVAVLVNQGIAAVFWLLVAEFGSRLLRFAGARVA